MEVSVVPKIYSEDLTDIKLTDIKIINYRE